MSQTNYTPIQLYHSTTATNVPDAGNLAAGELAINTADEKLFFKNASGTVKVLASTSNVFSGIVLNDGYTEEVFAVSGTTPALSPTNGSIQTWTLSANSTPTAGTWASGQSITLMIDDGTSYTVTWSSLPVVWVGGTAPTLATTGSTVIVLWKVDTTIYGALTGSVA